MATEKTVPYPAVNIASSSSAIVFGSSSSLHYLNPATAVSLSTPTAVPSSSYAAGSLLVRLVAISEDGRRAATISDDKSLRVYTLPSASDSTGTSPAGPTELKLLSTRYLSKKASALSFTPSPANDLLVSDKVGDVYLYPLEAIPETEGKTRPLPNELASDPSLNPDATFLAGHVSIVTCHVFTPDQMFIISADRDEHIRISHFPNAYNIERFLFGSEGFVSALHLVPSVASSSGADGAAENADILVSGGGESVMRIWDWRKGKQLAQVEIYDAVLPHRRARSAYRRIKDPKKRMIKPDSSIATVESGTTAEDFYEPPEGYMLPAGQGILIRKISSVEVDGQTVVLFFSEGCAALHSFILPSESSAPTEIQTLPLPYPLIDFTAVPSQPSQLLLSLDTAFGVISENPPPTKPPTKVFDLNEEQLSELKRSWRVVEISSRGELSDISSTSSTLLDPLHATLSQSTNLTTPDTRSTLPMYGDLSLYPRWPGLEEDDDLAGPAPAAANLSAETDSPAGSGGNAGQKGTGKGRRGGNSKGDNNTSNSNSNSNRGGGGAGNETREEAPGSKIKKDYTRQELENMGVKQLGRLKAHGVDVSDLLLKRKKDAKARGKRRKLEEGGVTGGAESVTAGAEVDGDLGEEDAIANAMA